MSRTLYNKTENVSKNVKVYVNESVFINSSLIALLILAFMLFFNNF